MNVIVALWYRLPLGMEQVVSSIPGSVGYIYLMFFELLTLVPLGFSGYIWRFDTKIVLKNENKGKVKLDHTNNVFTFLQIINSSLFF